MGRGAGDDDRVKGAVFLPSLISVSDFYMNIPVSQFRKLFFGLFSQRLNDFDGVDLLVQFREDGGLVSGAGTDFQNGFAFFRF